MSTLFKSIYCSVALLFAATFLTLGLSASQDDNPPELSEKIQEGIPPLTALFEAKKWDDALVNINALLTKAESKSYDRAFLNALKAQIMGSKGDLNGAIGPLEIMLKLGDELKLFRFPHALPIGEQDAVINLASLYMQDASTPGKSVEQQRAALAKAHAYGKRLISEKKVTVEGQTMWARILYSEATIDPAKVDLTLMKQASAEAYKALEMVIKPREEQYVLYLATLQQLGEISKSAEYLELLVKQFPNNSKSYWPMLFNSYVSLQGSTERGLSADMSAVVTLERAQAAGQMVSNKDNYMLAGLYYNMQQYEFAADLLEKGLHSGKIDSEQKNWELLAGCYQQIGKDARAIDVYSQAIKLFPKSPVLEQQLGQIYYSNDKHGEAYKHFQAAVNKGLVKPGSTLVLISYIALEMKNLDEALDAAEKAVAADPRSKEAQSLLKVIKESIEEREKFKNT